MATTQTTYTGNGSTTNYSFTFEYLKQADVKVTLNTAATTAYTFANATTLSFNTAPANGVAIRIFRDTPSETLSSTFFPGSAIKAEDLNENFTQNLYVTQESDAEAASATTTANGAVTTANAATTTANSAVTTANAADTKSDAAVATANTASTTAGSAVTTANAATATANTASSSAASAVTTANTASTNATAAVNTANTASTNASAAVTTANSSQADATTAVNTANAATTTANNATTTANSAVTTANTANTNATAAQSAATTAQTSATAAQTSATAAQTSATAAQAQATLAADVRNAFTITDSNSDGTFDFVVSDIPIKGNNGVKLPFESVTYAEEGAIRYNNSLDKIELYNGAGQWVTAAGGAAVSSSPPSLPSAGDVWYDHDNGRAYVYYNDGDSNQWVEMNPSWNGYVADDSVTTAKIADDAVTAAKLADTSVTAGSYTLSNITVDAQGRITSAASGTASDADKIVEGNTQAEVVDTGSNGHFKVTTEGTERLKIDSAGRVLIGTTTEGYSFADTLTIAESGHSGITIRSGTTSNGAVYFSDATSGAGEYDGWVDYSHNNRAMQFGIAATERMRIDSSGNVMVGLTSGPGKLQVAGGIRVAGSASHSDTSSPYIYRTSGADNLCISTSSVERLRINSSGNVGIGETSADTRLHVKASSSTNTGIFIQNSNGATNSSADLFFGNWSGSSTTTPQARIQALNKNVNTAATDLAFWTYSGSSTLERMRIDSSGNVQARRTRSNTTGDVALSIQPTDSTVHYGFRIDQTNNNLNLDKVGTGTFLTIDNSGKLLVGLSTTADNNAQLQVSSTNFGVAQLFRTGSTGASLHISSTTGTLASPNALSNGDHAGYVSFRAYDGATWRTGANIGAAADGQTWASGDCPGRLVFATTADGASSPTERMRITSAGRMYLYGNPNLFISNTASAGTSQVMIAGGYSASSVTSSTLSFRVYNNGNVQNTNNSYGAISDAKLKENIVDASSQWDDLKAIQIRNYNFIEGQTHTQIGVVAQEVELVSPGLVSESPDRDADDNDLGTVTKSVNYSVLYMKAVKALQEAMERIETLETKVTALEGA